MLALAFLVPLVAGVYDLSVGAMMGLSLVIINWLGANTAASADRGSSPSARSPSAPLVGLVSAVRGREVPGQLARSPRSA